jgi:hypothetical protein
MNLKTTMAGIGSILAAIGFALKAIFDNDPTTNVDIGATIAAVTAGVGLIAAKDAKPTGPTLTNPVDGPKP